MRLFYMAVLLLCSSGVYAMEIQRDSDPENIRKFFQPSLYSKRNYLFPNLINNIPTRVNTLNIIRARKSKEPYNEEVFEQLEQEMFKHHMELLKLAFTQKNHEIFRVIIDNFPELKKRDDYGAFIPLIRNKIGIDSSYQENEWQQILANYPPEESR